MSKKVLLSVSTCSGDYEPSVLPRQQYSTPNTPSPLASGKRQTNLTVQTGTNNSQPSVFDFSEFEKEINSNTIADTDVVSRPSMNLKIGVSPPTYSPKSFLQRYDIFGPNQNTSALSDDGLSGWGSINQNFITPSESTQNELAPYLLDTESRALVMFHPPSLSPLAIKSACQKFGVLYYIKSNFHSKGVTFISYFDVRSSISAQTKLARLFSTDGIEIAVHYGIMLGESYANSDAKLNLKNINGDVSENEIQKEFSKLGPLSSIQRKFMVRADSPRENTDEPSLCEFSIEYFNIQDAKKAFDQLNPKISEIFGSKAELCLCKAGARSTKLLVTLTNLLLSWRAALIAQGIECSSPVTSSSPKFFPNMKKKDEIKAKDEVTLRTDDSPDTDENSDPSSPCPSPRNSKARQLSSDDTPLAELAKLDRGGKPLSRLLHTKYRETELGLVEVTPPVSPAGFKVKVPKQVDIPAEENYHGIPLDEPSAEAFQNYRQQLLMEHQKLLQMQETMLANIPRDDFYSQYQHHAPYRGAQIQRHSTDAHMSMNERDIGRRYPPVRDGPRGHVGGRGFQREMGGEWRDRGGYELSHYGDSGMYRQEQWSSGHGGYGSTYNASRSERNVLNSHSDRLQGGRSGGHFEDYGYDFDLSVPDFDPRARGMGPGYGPPAPYPPGAHFNGNPNVGYPPVRGGYLARDVERGYEQPWTGRDHQEMNKANPTFTVRVEDVLSGADNRVTIMVKNIPNKYSQAMLLDEIDAIQSVSYDFFYLPMDFRNRCNVGYAFINFTDRNDVVVFFSHFHGRKWNHFNSEKVCAVTYARIQGKQSLVLRYQNSSLLDREDSYKPLLFYSRGHPLEGQPEPFPHPGSSSGRPRYPIYH